MIGAGNFSSIYGNISADDAIAQGDICDLTELVPKYAPNYYKIIQQKDIKDIAYTDSGRIAAVYSIKQNSQKPWCGLQIRKDWLDELGLEIPVTYDDWETVLTAFKEKKGATAPLWISYDAYAQDESLNAGLESVMIFSNGRQGLLWTCQAGMEGLSHFNEPLVSERSDRC